MNSKSMNYREIIAKAHAAGMAAGNAARVEPLGHIVVSGGSSEPRHFYESHGVCGFAWVEVHPNRGAFAKALKGYGFRPGYPKGLSNWVSEFGQEYDRKMAYARAYAKVLNEEVDGYNIYANGRLD